MRYQYLMFIGILQLSRRYFLQNEQMDLRNRKKNYKNTDIQLTFATMFFYQQYFIKVNCIKPLHFEVKNHPFYF